MANPPVSDSDPSVTRSAGWLEAQRAVAEGERLARRRRAKAYAVFKAGLAVVAEKNTALLALSVQAQRRKIEADKQAEAQQRRLSMWGR